MLGDAGSVASLAGVAVSLVGLGFAILQLIRLRGETRAAREAAEATRKALGRDLAIADVNRPQERLQVLKEIHRDGNRQRALDRYPEIIELLRDIRRRHPGLSDADRANIRRAVTEISEMERTVEQLEQNIPRDLWTRFNQTLTGFQSGLLAELKDRLRQISGW